MFIVPVPKSVMSLTIRGTVTVSPGSAVTSAMDTVVAAQHCTASDNSKHADNTFIKFVLSCFIAFFQFINIY